TPQFCILLTLYSFPTRRSSDLTTIYHFLFVPLTIGLSFIVAVLQTFWYRTGKHEYLQATQFFGKLFLINFAMGVVTGIVQEFQRSEEHTSELQSRFDLVCRLLL